MGDDRASPGGADPSTVPIESIPAPVVGYDIEDGEPSITETNSAFESTFDTGATGTVIRRWLRTVGTGDVPVEEVCSRLADGDRVDTELRLQEGDDRGNERWYRLRTLGPADGEAGHVLLTEGSPCRDGIEADRLASVISHDLRNPLDVATAHLRAARETGEEEHLDQLERSHDRMERIIQDVLTLARGENALNVVPAVDIETVATEAWATVDTETASLTLSGDLPTIEADPDRLQRLFENLFRNSIEHGSTGSRTGSGDGVEHGSPNSRPEADDGTGEGGVQVRVGPTEDGFFVADDGPGVPAEERSRVFDPGFSSHGSRDGTGLGLPIVERIVTAHDWSVSVTSGPLGGARFEFHEVRST
ncbi:sensor histidine kinase [Haloglomus litoreum]|uniref:sensor histidine kinase n=1 Tax=Haloglomus litoreum TaxID=3034026 RepID=UPI0023E7DC97|nr:HAMP domain-containing sensor histidine kinase [Haloglomus sp. DT116]